MSQPFNMDLMKDEKVRTSQNELQSLLDEHRSAIHEIGETLQCLKISNNVYIDPRGCGIHFVKQNRELSKEVFGLMMRAHYRKNDQGKFQPCQDELHFLRSMAKASALCANLRFRASLKEFYMILHPGDLHVKLVGHEFRIADDCLDNKDSIFHLHQDSVRKDIKEFNDLTTRAEEFAKAIHETDIQEVHLSLLDGHGRMLVCLLKALDEKGILERVEAIRVYEIDPTVYKYHEFVLPLFIDNINHSIIRGLSPHYENEISVGGFVYLNFCSIPSTAEFDWTAHFKEQGDMNWVPGCCKENVLRYIWKVIHPPYYNTVMVSCVIKHLLKPKQYSHVFRETLGNYITGLGFLYMLLLPDLFNAEIISIRPENEIQWEGNDKRTPIKLRSGPKGCPFVTLLVKRCVLSDLQLENCFKTEKIANLMEDKFQVGAYVSVTDGKYRGFEGHITKRTAAKVWIGEKQVNIDKVRCK